MNKKLMIVLILGMFMLLPMISAAPPVTTAFIGNEGLDIQANFQNYYRINEAASIDIFVFNISNGEQLDNTTVTCAVELTDRNGTVLLEGVPLFDETHFVMSRAASIVTKTGSYAVTIVCNTSLLAGYKTAFFEANRLGVGLSPAIATLNLGLLALMLILFLVSIAGMFMLPEKKELKEDGEIINRGWLTYFKPVLFMVSWSLLMATLFLSSTIALQYLQIDTFGKLLFTLFQVMYRLTLPLIVGWIIWIFVSIFQDKEMKKMIERGGDDFGDI